MYYDLSHLIQPDHQKVCGPIQDDEALLLFAVIKVMRMQCILEIGGLNGYSAINFCKALGEHGILYTCDINPINVCAANHRVIQKDAKLIKKNDLDNDELDMIFFDCHDYQSQVALFISLSRENVITDKTILAFHDTGLHPNKFSPQSYLVNGEELGFVHQSVERQMVNDFKRIGYDAICFHTQMKRHNDSFPFRHGITLMAKFRHLTT